MGNCIKVVFIPRQDQRKINVVVYRGGEHKFKASTPVQSITSGPYTGYKLVHNARLYTPWAPDTKLELGEVYHLVPDLASLLGNPLVPSRIVCQEGCKRKKNKVVVTREQLEELLKSANKLWSKENGVGLSGRFRLDPPKWQPSSAIVFEG